MGKINLNDRLFKHPYRQVFLPVRRSKCRFSIKRIGFFLNTLVLLSFLPATFIQAQYYNQVPEFLNANSKWVFGQGAGLDFSNGAAVPFASATTQVEGDASVAHPVTGDLLFYTNGGSVWNASDALMPNGTGLLGNGNTGHIGNYQNKQGVCIVPVIGNDSQYYVFSAVMQVPIRNDSLMGSLFYSIVDMTLDNGLGDIVAAKKNIVLDTNGLAEGMIAIPGCNNDIWLIVCSSSEFNPQYKAYHITEEGINPNPVISSGKVKTAIDPNAANIAQFPSSMAVSPDRSKIARANGYLSYSEVGEFNPATGEVLNPIPIFIDEGDNGRGSGAQGCAFSPDNSKLYFSYTKFILSTFTLGGGLLQFEVNIMDSSTIASSKQVIDSTIFGGGIRLFKDTIYTSEYGNTFSIGKINSPNSLGTACNFQPNAIALIGTNSQASLPNEVVFAIKSDSLYSVLDTVICSGWDEGVYLEASDTSYSSYTWSTGDSSSSIQINGHGTYWVSYFECNKYHRDSFVVKGSDLYTDITVNGHQLGTTGGPFSTYQWYLNGEKIPGATGPTLTVTQNGDYTVEITDEYGCIFMSAIYKVNNVNIQDVQALARAIRVYPNPATEIINIDAPVIMRFVLTAIDGKELIKGDNSSPVLIGSLAQGIYFLTIADREGRVLKTEKIIKLP